MQSRAQQGSVTLVALCFVAVLGIGLAGYLAVTNQSMKLSNRSYVTGVSRQLAESGLEQALWSFNRNDWSSWTLSGNTATRTITFPSTKYGSSGLTTAINLRVDNYNAYNQSSIWAAGTIYRLNDLVGNGGIWYRCLVNHPAAIASQPPNLAYWAEAPIPWTWNSGTTYSVEDVVNVTGVWYRCTTANSNQVPPNVSYWAVIPSISLTWSASTTYSNGSIVYSNGIWWSCILAINLGVVPGTNISVWLPNNPPISWRWRLGGTYKFNDVVYYPAPGGMGPPIPAWYRYINGTSTSGNLPTNTTYWENALSGTMWGWNSGYAYNLGDAVYRNGSWYRCILAHTNQGPPNSTYWVTAPLKSNAWDSGRQYSQYDTVSYNGVWYLCLSANNGVVPPTNTSDWASTADATRQWNSATAYTTSSYVSYSGVWYHCISGNTAITPNNSTYWTALGAPVIYAEGTATLPNGTATIKTQLRATVAPAPLFPNAAAATTSLTLGAGGTVDSFNGSVNAITTGGTYTTYTYKQTTSPFASSPNWNLGYSAVLAASGTTSPAVTVTSARVQGYVAAPSASTTPYAPIWTYGGSAVLTGTAAGSGIDLARVSRSPYIPQFDSLPSGGLSANWGTTPLGTALALSATTNIGTPGATTPSRYYYNDDLTLSGTTSILNVNGPVILYINGDLIMDSGTPNGLININSTGAAEIHIAGRLNVNIGADGINNITKDPKKLILICDTSASSAQNYSDGTNQVYGVIYIPNTTNASGLVIDNNNVQIYGAISAKKITYSGANANLHYDTSLRYATFGGVDQPYAIMELRQLTDPAEKVTLP